MSFRAAPWGRPSLPGGRHPARPHGPFGGMNAWRNSILKNSWRFGGTPINFGLPSALFRCMASSTSGGGTFSRPTSTDEGPMPIYSWPDKQRPRVCILGGGFGGLYTALRLESLVWPNDKKPQVMLVDQSDRFVFKPMLYELLSGVDVWEIAPSFMELLKNTSVQFVKDSVKLLRPSDHFRRESGGSCTGGVVHLESGTVVEYDWLVLALGAEAKIDVVPGSAEYAIPFTTLDDALKVESQLKMLERRRFGRSIPDIQVAIVGLGYSGVELAATISERLKNTGTVQAINVQTTICPSAPPGNRDAALKVLESRNIQLFLGYFVKCIREASASEDSVTTDTDAKEVNGDHKKLLLELQPAQRGLQSQVLEADMVLWTVGSTSQIPRLQPPDAPYVIPLNGRGQVETEETLQVKGHPRTFAIGDSAALRDPSGKLLPATAQVAFQQADFAGWNLWAAINDRPLLPFRFQNLGEMMTLGRSDAAITASFIEGLTLEGPIGHAARKIVYCLRMPTDEHRVKVGISWLTKTAVDSLASLQNASPAPFAVGGQLISSRSRHHQPLAARHGSRHRGRLRLPTLPLPVQERPHLPPRRRGHGARRRRPRHRRRLPGHPRRRRQGARVPPARRRRVDREAAGCCVLPWWRVRHRLARQAWHPRLPQRPRGSVRRDWGVRVLPPRAGEPAPGGVRGRVGGCAVGGHPRGRRRPVAARPRRSVPLLPRRVQRRRQHRPQHGRPLRRRRRRAPGRRDPPRPRGGPPLLHRQGGRGRRDGVRPRGPRVLRPDMALRVPGDVRAGRPAREPVRRRRGARRRRRDPVRARAGVRGREGLLPQGAGAVVPPGAQGERLWRRAGAVRVQGRRPRVPLRHARLRPGRRAAGDQRCIHQEMKLAAGGDSDLKTV
ncbi:alternative NAD(P)H-ubiquinone oxidoreductase C1, chloroplastic/mitochondrial isoform X2 [Oryza brachyantha]|uniref:alternative NAD(P)H-ubiquinone oxidoreductase C1, chloroplastic/mitochondrial isoform X2 n=1 Tax=Oryza brachyantha TaxID=4533 RepID=UPI001AD9B92E|nr:alternative NAD(P)H-ubiquinone oxidoreductase C1, chloroplastic/mitochondrial isoform X2 [Oryza brachyantha]